MINKAKYGSQSDKQGSNIKQIHGFVLNAIYMVISEECYNLISVTRRIR